MTDEPPDALKARVARRYGLLASTWDRIGPRIFALAGQKLVELSEVAPRDRVLDVGMGRGAVLFAAAERAGPSGRIIGIDISEEMVALTAREIEERGLANAEVYAMDAESLDLPDGWFDCVLCGAALFFFPHVVQALAQFHRVLRPGGRFGATTFGRNDERWGWWPALRQQFGVEPRYAVRHFEDPAEVPAVLAQAGFVNIRVSESEFELVYADEEEWWASQHVDLEGVLDSDTLARLQAAAFGQVRALKGPDGIHRWAGIRCYLAGKPML